MIYTIAEAKERNREAGYHWFSPESMRFFSSRLPKSVYPVDNGALFVSSEQQVPNVTVATNVHEWPRRYSVRFIHDNGKVSTVGEFQQYARRESANRKAEKLQRDWTVDASI